MYYKKEHFILLLKDIVNYLNLLYNKGGNFKLSILNNNNLSLNIVKPYEINNRKFSISFNQKKTRKHLKIIIYFEREKQLIIYFDNEFKDIQIFLNNNNNKINIKKYAIFFKEEYDLSSEKEFSSYIDIFLKKYKIFDNLQSFCLI